MSIHHAAPGEVIDVRPPGENLQAVQTRTLVKTENLEVIRLVLRKGKNIATHSVPGVITVHCIQGRVTLSASGRPSELTPGSMVYLNPGEPHSVHASEDSSLLITIVLPVHVTQPA